ncbi:IS66 family transposase [Segatella copri]|uniref:IS66 family transposase n=1 Tax=Segatella copri TaxID=165179 RepID=UPI002939D728|nr:IS66 family transposase [Segatella copri]MDV3106913.1 IS66 family transposase [Segatella copri]
MKKDEIIELLKEQLRVANDTVSSLTTQVNELIERIKSLEELLVQKGIAIDKVNRQNKALGKLVSGKKSERQEKNPQDSMTQEEFDKKKTEQAERRKARKNNGAKRDMHYEMEEVHVTIDPVMDAELLKTLRLFGTRTCIRYSMEPIKFIKTVYHINTYTDGSIMYPGKTPPALLLNSSYSPSFAAGLLQMRYIYSMPVERIIKYFADNGFTLRKATANKLIARSADVLENFYKAICQVVLLQDYVSADETYHKVLLAKTKPTDKGSKKGYLWAVSAPILGLVFFVYEDGSRSEQVILNVFSDYKGTIQSDAYAPYRKLESDAYPDIMRIACLQHVKRDFIDCGKEDKDAQEVVDILNRFYREDKKHKVGVNGWTVEDHLAYRQSYAPDILQDLLEKLEEISSRKDLLPKSTLAQAVGYALNEYNAICDIFKRGDTALDNNYIERIQRYISLSRRNSMFFGSHEGASRAAILYSIAISCRLNGINLFEYICDVIEKTAVWQPNTPLEKYRDLLPDRWKKQ